MAWCPKCRNEYVEGIQVCADCGSELVETLPSESEETILYGGIQTTVNPDFAQASVLDDAEKQEETAGREYHSVYKDNAQKAADCKESGYTLVGVGALGLLAGILSAAGVIPMRMQGSAAVLSYGVMGTVFLIFLVVGIRSMQSAKSYRKKALKESNLKEQIMNWCRENLTAEKIETALTEEGLSEEEKYFKRTEQMKTLISHSFINIEEGFLDNLIDEFYPELFEGK